MALPFAAVGGKVTAAGQNALVTSTNGAAMQAIIPSSIAGTGVSLTATGRVNFSAASTVSVNGCFNAVYDDYLIRVKMTAHAGALDTLMRLRQSGTDSSATNYAQQRLTGTTTIAATNNLSAQGQWTVDAGGSAATIYDRSDIILEGPNLATITTGETSFTSISSATNMVVGQGSLFNSLTTQFDGFTFFVASGTMTGTVRIYGYNV